MEFLYEYGLFVAKAITIVVAIGLVIGLIVNAASKGKVSGKGELYVDNISEDIEDTIVDLKRSFLNKDELKAFDKNLKKELKKESKNKESEKRSKLFVISFDGGVYADEVESLREEISAIISIAQPEDKVLIKLESPGGVVHGYGLASSQIARLRNANIEVIASVDKVAASGGYMMACVANKIISAPFAIIGSIGVVAQLPNFNKLLKKHDVEIEQHTAGNFKRTLTMLGENTDEARDKFKQELADTHILFKDFVSEYRPQLDIEKVATGEHWYGKQALDLKLVDELSTSDDFVLNAVKDHTLYKVEYKIKQKLAEKLGVAAAAGISSMVSKMTTWSFTANK
ncbi:protease SohB [Psychrosphaera aquimarina]|uniref:Protease SohB n=1 Tax=Psychrosphaera aquimarina TaxID=2044854 RepID=A0ABU3QVZ4_9GAMM|nr:protease SohB [Psychrosphaera aquimarina]MDU0111609.1 protease SohB [Psychrosphaera aquimarina]